MIRKTAAFLVASLVVTSLAVIGYWMLFSSFAVYDDEGYILISAREYFAQGKLYETVYAQYGPAFYVLMDLFQRALGAPVDHTWARLLTLALWLGTAGCCAQVVWRQTASRSLTLFTLTATFLYLYFITDEPFHPGSLIFFLIAASVSAASGLINAGRMTGATVIAACTGAILLLTKINVGVFYVASVMGWAVLHAASDHARRRAGPWVAAAFLLLAVALMHTLLREAWVQIYLVIFAGGTVTLVLGLQGEGLVKPRHAGWFAVTGGSLGLVVLSLVWLRGTSFAGLMDGVLLGPLRHPGNYSYPVDWRPGSLLVAGLSLALALAHPWIGRRFSTHAANRLIVALRLIVGAALLCGIALLMNFRAVGAIFSYVAPLIWIWVIPLNGLPQSPTVRASRGLLATILLLQYLHAYPVGGSQESWGTFLFIPLVALGLGDVRTWLMLRPAVGAAGDRWWPRIGGLCAAVLIAKTGWTAVVAQRDYAARSALGLPGATQLHLPESQRVAYRILALNAAVHTDMLFSLPGMFSFNLWTDLPAPTGKNTTLWFTLLNDAEQQEIIRTLERTPRAGLIVQETLVELMRANQIPMRGPLWDYLHQNFRSAFTVDGFAFWVENRRIIAPLNIATVSRRTSLDSADHRPDTQVEFNLVSDGTPITVVEVRTGRAPQAAALRLDAANTTVNLTVINRAGQALAGPNLASWPLTSKGLVHVLVHFDRGGLTLAPGTATLSLKDAKGENLGEIWIGK